MSAKGMGDIDELLAEISGEKQNRPAANSDEVDNILKSLGKPSAKGESTSAPENAKKQKADSSKTADSLFNSFFDDGIANGSKAEAKINSVKPAKADVRSQAPKPAEKESTDGQAEKANASKPMQEVKAQAEDKKTSRFSDAMFAETFGAKQEPVTKQESRAKREGKEVAAITSLPEKHEEEINDGSGVRRVGVAPSAGSLRGKILSAAKNAAFSTEEDEEYLPVSPQKLPNADKPEQATENDTAEESSEAVMKAYAEFFGPDEKAEPINGKADADEAQQREGPTLEFPAMGGKGVKPRENIVLRPDGEGASAQSQYDIPKRTQTVMMSEVDDTFREFFGETVAVSRSEIEEGLRSKSSGKLFSRLFSKSESEPDEYEDDDDNEEALEETEDYNSPSDAPAVESTLASMRGTATLRVIATSLCCALLVYLGLSARTGLLPAIPVLNPANEPMLYLVANLALLLIAGLVCIPTIAGGFASLFKEPSADILTAVCFTGAFIQNLAYLIKPAAFDPVKITLFAPIAAAALCASAVGKRMQCTTVCRNFETVSVGYDHSAAFLLKNREVAAKVCRELEDDEPALLVSRPTSLVKGFLKQSFSQCRHASAAKILSLVVLGVGLIALIFTYFQADSFFSGLTAFAAVCSLCAPFSATLLHAVPASLMQKSTARVGAIVPGWSAIDELGKTNSILINARDLFPRECIRLHGIKTFEKERIDLAILYAASILVEGCDTLRDIFLGVIENKTEMLYKVDSLAVDPGLGFTAWVEHTRVIVGNRLIMQKHDIALPSLDYEMKYTKGERCPVYLAVAGKLFGMFLVSYSPSDEADEVLFTLTKSGISVVIKSDDFNLTGDMVAQLYGLNRNQVKVLNASERDALAPLTAYLPESEGILTHLGSLPSFAGGLRAASAAQGGLKLAFIVQIAAAALGVVLCLLLMLSKSLVGISLTAVLLFQLAWTALTVIVPFTKRY